MSAGPSDVHRSLRGWYMWTVFGGPRPSLSDCDDDGGRRASERFTTEPRFVPESQIHCGSNPILSMSALNRASARKSSKPGVTLTTLMDDARSSYARSNQPMAASALPRPA